MSNPLNNYTFVKKLGRGKFGETALYTDKSDKAKCVVKKINLLEKGHKKSAEAEVKLLSRLKCRHVVSYKTSFDYQDCTYIVMEYCEGGDLGDYIETYKQQKPPASISQQLVVEWTLQLCDGLEFIHSKNIIHRDMKPDNIFLTRARNLKIGDFGVGRELQPEDWAGTICGTRCYMSPEIYRGQKHDSRTDVWSLGCTVAELMTLQLPFIMTPIENDFHIRLLPLPRDKYSGEFVDVVQSMLTEDNSKRPTIGQLQQTDYLKTARDSARQKPCNIHDIMLLLDVGSNKTKHVMANQNWTLRQLQDRMSDELNSPSDTFVLYADGTELDNQELLEDCHLQHQSLIHVVYKLPGGDRNFTVDLRTT